MKTQSVIITGTTGMVGKGVLLTALNDPSISHVLSLARRPVEGVSHPKLRQLTVPDFYDLSGIAGELAGYDAVLHCLGMSSVGIKEAEYTRVTYDLTMELARTFLRVSPHGSFCYISGASTDPNGSQMWARVKGRTELDLLKMPFRHVHMFRPGFIRPLPGAGPVVGWIKVLYTILKPVFPLVMAFKGFSTTNERLARAMFRAASDGYSKPILEVRDINALGA